MNEIFCVNEYAVPTLNAFCGICLWFSFSSNGNVENSQFLDSFDECNDRHSVPG